MIVGFEILQWLVYLCVMHGPKFVARMLVMRRVANPPGTGGRLPEFKSISRPEMLISRNSGVQNAKKCALFWFLQDN